jgi:dTDP-4-dehydrorhamnose reductase
MKYLITGSSGQLGSAFSHLLDTSGRAFHALSRNELDISDSGKLLNLVRAIKPDVIINTAGWTNVDQAELNEFEAMKVNALAVGSLSEICAAQEVKLVHFSTDYVFSGEEKISYKTDSHKNPLNVYGRSKSIGEDLVLSKYPQGSYVIRTAWLYSRWGRNFAKTITKQALNSTLPLRVIADQIGQPTSALDLAAFTIDLVENQEGGGVFHGTNAGEASWYQFACKIFALVGADIERITPVMSKDFEQVAQRPKYSVLENNNWDLARTGVMRNWEVALESEIQAIVTFAQKDS